MFIQSHGAQFLPFELFNGFPTLAVHLDVKIGVHGLIIALKRDAFSLRVTRRHWAEEVRCFFVGGVIDLTPVPSPKGDGCLAWL